MNYLKLLLILIFAFFLQGAGWSNLLGGEIIPDFLLIIVILLQQWLGWKEGILLGFTAGVIADVFSFGEIGIYSFVYLTAPFLMQSVRSYLEIESIVFQTGYIIAFTFSSVAANLFYAGYVLDLDGVTILFIAKAFAVQIFLNLIFFYILRLIMMKIMCKPYFTERKSSLA